MSSHGPYVMSDFPYAVQKLQGSLGAPNLATYISRYLEYVLTSKNISTLTSNVQTSVARSLSEARLFAVVMMIDM
jgi:hypothetical protein